MKFIIKRNGSFSTLHYTNIGGNTESSAATTLIKKALQTHESLEQILTLRWAKKSEREDE